ncbi:MAG: chorismate lyase, partial [Saccharospirillum sp.]
MASQALDMRQHNWYDLDEMADQLPAPWRYWLELPGSLTRALRQRSDAFSVQVLAEGNLHLTTPLAAFAGQPDALSCWSLNSLWKPCSTMNT